MFSNRSGQRKEVLCCGNTRTGAVDAMDCNLQLSPGQFNGLMLRGTPEYVQYISKEVLARLN